MANGGGSGRAREDDAGLLYPGARRWGVLLACQGNQVMVWAAAWPEYDEVWVAACDGRWPMAACGRRGVASA
jgi:hypothetical protein